MFLVFHYDQADPLSAALFGRLLVLQTVILHGELLALLLLTYS